MQSLDTPAQGMLQEMSEGNTTPRVSTALASDDRRRANGRSRVQSMLGWDGEITAGIRVER
jgi:hypothetical protein